MAWREPLLSAAQIILIVLVTWLLPRILTRGITRLGARYPQLPVELLMPLQQPAAFFASGSALILILGRLGGSAQVLWAALTGFVVVAAIAFFCDLERFVQHVLCAADFYHGAVAHRRWCRSAGG
jgi:hypothetical protein